MKPAFTREYRKFGLVHARKPQTGYPVAGVVQVIAGEESGVVYVKFQEALVDAVGRVLPYGVSDEQPCFLKVIKLPTGKWRVMAYYLGSRRGRILWEADRPLWIKHVRKGGSNGTHNEEA